jgi:hypothetical protein
MNRIISKTLAIPASWLELDEAARRPQTDLSLSMNERPIPALALHGVQMVTVP